MQRVKQIRKLTAFKQFRFFPNASAQYNFNNSIYFNMNYKKDNATKYISIESNNTNYQNPNIDYSGNETALR
jgi:hypothetical protein